MAPGDSGESDLGDRLPSRCSGSSRRVGAGANQSGALEMTTSSGIMDVYDPDRACDFLAVQFRDSDHYPPRPASTMARVTRRGLAKSAILLFSGNPLGQVACRATKPCMGGDIMVRNPGRHHLRNVRATSSESANREGRVTMPRKLILLFASSAAAVTVGISTYAQQPPTRTPTDLAAMTELGVSRRAFRISGHRARARRPRRRAPAGSAPRDRRPRS
jgi:hypothetical protein